MVGCCRHQRRQAFYRLPEVIDVDNEQLLAADRLKRFGEEKRFSPHCRLAGSERALSMARQEPIESMDDRTQNPLQAPVSRCCFRHNQRDLPSNDPTAITACFCAERSD